MQRENESSIFQLGNLAKYGLGLLVVLFLSFLFPKSEPFPYEFKQGTPWNYPSLVAAQDIPLLDTTMETPASNPMPEKKSIAQYGLDKEIATKQKAIFAQAFQKQIRLARIENQFPNVLSQPDLYLEFAQQLMERIYQKGVIGNGEIEGREAEEQIYLKVGDLSQSKILGDLYTVEAIELMLGDSLFNSGLAEAEFLIPLLSDVFVPNVTFLEQVPQLSTGNDLATNKSKEIILVGEQIIAEGAIVDEVAYSKLQAYQKNYQSTSTRSGIFAGYFLLTSLLMGLFLFFLQFNYPIVFASFRKLLFMLLWFVVYGYLIYLLENNELLSVYAIPFCIVPIVVKVFFNDRLALFLHVLVVLMASIISSEDYEFTFVQILAGIVVVLANIEMRNWSRFFLSIFYIFLAYALAYLGFSLIKEGSLLAIDYQAFIWLFVSVFLTLLAYPLIPLLERLFGFTSAITLVELSDMNRPLLKELSLKAPGTMQHSLQVGHLSEAAAAAIGADTLLVKVAALYHDIGKIPQAIYFIENQSGDNPHDALEEFASTKIIIDHVLEGEKMARKAGLPELIIDFIRSHHGDTRVEYFYQQFIKNNPDRQFDESLFHYPGPKPKTKEETILMMADSLEAACKSLKNPTAKDLDERVDKIVAGKIRTGQLLESEITFQELEICVQEFKKLLKSIYHVRIEY